MAIFWSLDKNKKINAQYYCNKAVIRRCDCMKTYIIKYYGLTFVVILAALHIICEKTIKHLPMLKRLFRILRRPS